jgi:FtsH-binding integral membrane protein
MKGHSYLFWVAFGISFAIMLFLFGCNNLVRKVPYNYFILFIFTFFESYMIAAISIYQDPVNVLIAAVITFGMFFGLTVLTFFVTFITGPNVSINSAKLM